MPGPDAPSEVQKLRAQLAAENEKFEAVHFELDAQRQVNSDVMAQLEDKQSRFGNLHAQLLEERRLHEMTSLKLARSAEDAAEHARIDSQRGLDNVQEKHAHREAIVDHEARWKAQIKSLTEDNERYKDQIKVLYRSMELLQQQVDMSNQKQLDYENRLNSKTSQSKSQQSSPKSSGPSVGGREGGSVSMAQVKLMEQTLIMMRTELKKTLGDKEALRDEMSVLIHEKEALRDEMRVFKEERDALAMERDRMSVQNVFQSLQQSQRSASWSGSVDEHEHCRTEADSARTRQKDVDVADEVADNTSQDGYGNTGRSQKDDAYATSGGHRQAGDRESTRVDSYDAASQSDFEISRGREERVDVEELRMIRAKFARMSTVFEKEQLRREALEAHVLSMRHAGGGGQTECAQCVEGERTRDREREDAEMCVMDAKAAVLTSRAECGRLRADLGHSLDCLKAAEEAKILLERALLDQHQRYQRQCDKLQVLQADETYHKLQTHLHSLQQHHNKSIEQQQQQQQQQQFSNHSREGGAVPISSAIFTAHSSSNRMINEREEERVLKVAASGVGLSSSAGAEHTKSRVDFALHTTQSPVTHGRTSGSNGNSTLFTSPSPSSAPTPPYNSTGANLNNTQHQRLTPSPSPASNTIFYTASSPSPTHMVSGLANASHTHTHMRMHSNTRHSQLSADPTVPSLSLPAEMKDNPDGVSFSKGRMAQNQTRSRQSSLPPRAREANKTPAKIKKSATGAGTQSLKASFTRGGGGGGGGARSTPLLKKTSPPTTQIQLQSDTRVGADGTGVGGWKGMGEDSMTALRVSNVSYFGPHSPFSSPTPMRLAADLVRNSPTSSMGVFTRSTNRNGSMDFRAPSESAFWHT